MRACVRVRSGWRCNRHGMQVLLALQGCLRFRSNQKCKYAYASTIFSLFTFQSYRFQMQMKCVTFDHNCIILLAANRVKVSVCAPYTVLVVFVMPSCAMCMIWNSLGLFGFRCCSTPLIYLFIVCMLSTISRPAGMPCILSKHVHYIYLCVYEMCHIAWICGPDTNWMSLFKTNICDRSSCCLVCHRHWRPLFLVLCIFQRSISIPHGLGLYGMRSEIDFMCRNVFRMPIYVRCAINEWNLLISNV